MCWNNYTNYWQFVLLLVSFQFCLFQKNRHTYSFVISPLHLVSSDQLRVVIAVGGYVRESSFVTQASFGDTT